MKTLELLPGLVHDIPPDLEAALANNPAAAAAWNEISAIARNEWICWVLGAKQAVTRAKRIKRTHNELAEGKRRPCCWSGCIHRTDKHPTPWSQKALMD